MQILDDALIKEIVGSENPGNWLIVSQHPELPYQWIIESLDPGFSLDFADIIGQHQNIAVSKYKAFLEKAKELHYEVAFTQDPTDLITTHESLQKPPEISLKSTLPGTVNGLLPFQVEGYNFLKDLDAGAVLWDTGTGKTALASALIKYHNKLADFDIAWVIVKSHNKINVQRTLHRLAEIDALILDGPQKRRQEILVDLLEAPRGTVVVTNYEKFRVDIAHIMPLFEKRVLCIFDEMPTKLKSRNTQLYKAIRKCLYKRVDLTNPRTESFRGYMLSATPIENSPEDFFNCVRLLDPSLFGTIKEFRDTYVRAYDPFGYTPSSWKNLDKMGAKAAHMVHKVNKSNSEISSQFPQIMEEPYFVDWHPEDRAIYSLIASEIKKKVEDSKFSQASIFGFISVMQMLCNAPSMVSQSAIDRESFELGFGPQRGSALAKELQQLLTRSLRDDTHTKLQVLQDLINDHPDEKIVIFSAYNQSFLPILSDHLNDWQIPHVMYDGTAKQKQQAQDYFQNEDFVRVFLSSDQGSDSISLEEASVVIHYDLPWKMTTYIQRQNRIHRITSGHDHVRFYRLLMADSIEERKWKLLEKKWKYHSSVFDNADSVDANFSRDELLELIG